MKKKQWLFILCAVALALSLLSACGTDSSSASEEPVPASAAVETESIALADVCAAYYPILQDSEAAINALSDALSATGYYKLSAGQVAIQDVTGDGIPELMMAVPSSTSMEYGCTDTDIVLYTYDQASGTAKELYRECFALQVAGGGEYCLFQEDDGTLRLYTSISDENWDCEFLTFNRDGAPEKFLRYNYTYFSGDNQKQQTVCHSGAWDPNREQKSEISKEEWSSQVNDMMSHLSGRAFYAFQYGEPVASEVRPLMSETKDICRTTADALAYLKENAGGKVTGARPSTASGTTASSTEGMIFPNSDTAAIDEASARSLSSDQLSHAINEIYARHHYRFHDAEILAEFEQYSWYSGTNSDMSSVAAEFNAMENQNLALLVKCSEDHHEEIYEDHDEDHEHSEHEGGHD